MEGDRESVLLSIPRDSSVTLRVFLGSNQPIHSFRVARRYAGWPVDGTTNHDPYPKEGIRRALKTAVAFLVLLSVRKPQGGKTFLTIAMQIDALGERCQQVREQIALDQIELCVTRTDGRESLVFWVAEAADAGRQRAGYATAPPRAALPAPAATATATAPTGAPTGAPRALPPRRPRREAAPPPPAEGG